MMNKANTWLLTGTLLAASLTTLAQQGTFTIQGQSAGLAKPSGDASLYRYLPPPGKAFLLRYTIEGGAHKDSCTSADGKFTFAGTVGSTEIGQIVFTSGQTEESIVFYLEPGIIKIECPSDGNHAVVTGTPLNNDYQAYKEVLNHYLDSLNAGRPGERPYDQYSKEVQAGKLAIVRAFVEQYPASLVSLDELNKYAVKNPQQPEAVEPLYSQLSPALQHSKAGIQLATRIKGMRAGGIGDPAPPFTLPDTTGKDVSLSDFRGKYVLVDFWATWCGPCMAEMPNVAKAFHQYKDKGFAVVGVSLDRPDSKTAWLNVINRDHLDWVQVSDLQFWNSKAALAYNVNAVPANFLIDPQGNIVAKNLRGEALQTKLAELFK